MACNKDREYHNAQTQNSMSPNSAPLRNAAEIEFRVFNEANRIEDLALAMAYVPWQYFNETYDPDKALMNGTIFPELDKPFLGRRGQRS